MLISEQRLSKLRLEPLKNLNKDTFEKRLIWIFFKAYNKDKHIKNLRKFSIADIYVFFLALNMIRHTTTLEKTGNKCIRKVAPEKLLFNKKYFLDRQHVE